MTALKFFQTAPETGREAFILVLGDHFNHPVRITGQVLGGSYVYARRAGESESSMFAIGNLGPEPVLTEPVPA